LSKYIVNCYSPPVSYTLEPGEKVKVEGWVYSNNQILAERITKLDKPKVACRCGPIPTLPTIVKSSETDETILRREPIEVVGAVGTVEQSTSGLQFTLDV
jgi:hypothetical protein